MSAIFGICDTNQRPAEAQHLGLMQSALNHWAADAKGIWHEGSTGMGHLMLWNTPESLDERLPYTDMVSGLTITADARLDNRDELYSLLELDTEAARQASDSLLLLLAYRKYGSACTQRLLGDFAFAVWDTRDRKLFCARDHMGVKPFFYYFKDGLFAFASEKKGILSLPGIDASINKQYLYNQCFDSHIQAADTTLYRHIHRLPPAHTLTLVHDNITLSQYWTLDAYAELRLGSNEDYYEGLCHHFENAVRNRLRTAYPLGIELSGGIDSSTITGMAAHLLRGSGRPITTFTNGESEESLPHTPQKAGSEERYAREVIEFNQIANPVIIRKDISDDPAYVTDLLSTIYDGLERWNLSWQLPIKQEAMKRNIRTILSGFPGDEMVTYRGDFFFLDYLDQGKYLKYFSYKPPFRFNKLKPFIGPGPEFLLHKLRNVLRLRDMDIRRTATIMHFPLTNRLARSDEAWADINHRERFKSYRHYQRYRLLKPQTALRMETETAYGTWFRSEARFPMADVPLISFYLSMPNSLKYGGELSRAAWRQSLGKYLPPSVLQRDSKTGNMTPYAHMPSVQERTRGQLSAILHGFPGTTPAQQRAAFDFISQNGGGYKYVFIFDWVRKNFEKL